RTDLAECINGHILPPRNTADWKYDQHLPRNHGVVLNRAPQRTGRRTAALRLLMTVASVHLPIMDLEPEWTQPDAKKLPAAAGNGYLLDLSDMQEPGPRFGQGLLNHCSDGAKHASYLVVITTPDT